jgi:hypothetical protein
MFELSSSNITYICQTIFWRFSVSGWHRDKGGLPAFITGLGQLHKELAAPWN